MGKGSKRRPTQTSEEEMRKRWEETFRKMEEKKDDSKKT